MQSVRCVCHEAQADAHLFVPWAVIPPVPAVIWDALKAACEADLETARTILDSAGVIVAAADMSICYDERGRK